MGPRELGVGAENFDIPVFRHTNNNTMIQKIKSRGFKKAAIQTFSEKCKSYWSSSFLLKLLVLVFLIKSTAFFMGMVDILELGALENLSEQLEVVS